MLVLGTDPGIRAFGWSAVEFDGRSRRIIDARTVRTESGTRKDPTPLSQRWRAIRNSLEGRPWGVELVVYEEQAGTWQGKQRDGHTNAGGRLPQVAVGCIIAMADEWKVPVIGLQPRTIKKLFTGNGNASKRQIASVVAALPGCPKRMSEHAADAVATACAGYLAHKQTRVRR